MTVSVLHHTALQQRGGAVRVARLLHQGLQAAGVDSRLSYEFAEQDGAVPTPPDEVGAGLAPGDILHVHATSDWSALLGGVPAHARVVISLHDCSLFTGGCVSPVDCDRFNQECADPCPHRFPDSGRTFLEKKKGLADLNVSLAAPSRWMARLAELRLGRKVAVIPNNIPWPEKPAKAAARKALGIHPAAKVVLLAAHGGEKAAYKSGDRWLELWTRLKQQVPEALGFAVGGDEARREGDLLVWPYVDREKLGLLMEAADVLLYPTLADNHSLVILEALSHGLAPVAFAVGGVPEQIQDGVTGLLIRPRDYNGLVNHAAAVLTTPGRARELGQAGYDSGRARFGAEAMVTAYRKLYA